VFVYYVLAVLTGRPALEFPNRMAELQGGADSSQVDDGFNDCDRPCLSGAFASLSGSRLTIFGVVHVDQPPLSIFFSVNLGFDAMGRYLRSVLAHCGVEIPMEF
jgi:hypothetical protein